jgi:hypothetical protein
MPRLTIKRSSNELPIVKQSRIKRDWMDATYNKHAYQCLPMTYANVYGWELCLPHDVVVQWDGTANPAQIISGGEYGGMTIASGNISGMVSFRTNCAFQTDSGYDLWIGGSPNYFVDGAEALSAIIPSSWWPDPFEMNWKINKINEPVIFEAGSPFMFFHIFDNSLLQNTEVEFTDLFEDGEFVSQRQKYGEMKMKNQQENPWTWTKGIKTGLDADGNRIGPEFLGLPKLQEPK